MAKYIVTGAYVTVKTMTHQGPRILGLMAGAPVPDDAEPAWVKHHLETNLIVEVEDPAAVPSNEVFLTPIEQQEGVDPAERVREGEAHRARSAAAVQAAETRKANEAAAAKEAADKAKVEAAKPVVTKAQPKAAS